MNELCSQLVSQLEKFRKTHIDPYVEEDDKNETFRMDLFHKLGELGFCGATTSEKYGGTALGYSDYIHILRELAKSSVPYAVTVSVSSMVQAALEKYGNEEQKQKFLPSLSAGQGIGAFALSEAGSGSDAASLTTSATKSSGGYVLNGSKLWITSGGIAETYLVMARTGEEGAKGISTFIVPKDTKGFEFGKKESKMGWRTSPTRELIFSNCFIPKENLLSSEGDGFKIAMYALSMGRIAIGAISVGLSQRALYEALSYSTLRKQFKKEIFEFQGIQFMLADLATEVEASLLLVEKAAQLCDGGKDFQKIACMAKMKASDVAMKVSTDAVQILGGVGYTSEYPVERLMRDAKVLQIVEGTNQIQRVVIAKELKKEL